MQNSTVHCLNKSNIVHCLNKTKNNNHVNKVMVFAQVIASTTCSVRKAVFLSAISQLPVLKL